MAQNKIAVWNLLNHSLLYLKNFPQMWWTLGWVEEHPFSVVVDSILCLLSSGRYMDQTQPNIQDEGEEGRLCGWLPRRQSNCSRWSRSAHLFFSPSISNVLIDCSAVFCSKKDGQRGEAATCHLHWFPTLFGLPVEYNFPWCIMHLSVSTAVCKFPLKHSSQSPKSPSKWIGWEMISSLSV